MFLTEYPKRHQRALIIRWSINLFLIIILLIDIYCIASGKDEGKMAGAIYGSFLFLIFLTPMAVYGSIKEIFSVRIWPILEAKIKENRPYDLAPIALSYLHSSRGKAIARNYKTLVRIAKENSIQTLADFGLADTYDKNIVYYDPVAAMNALEKLLICLDNPGTPIKSKNTLIIEISSVLAILKEAEENEMKFCFALL